jgi:hypothetical protein
MTTFDWWIVGICVIGYVMVVVVIFAKFLRWLWSAHIMCKYVYDHNYDRLDEKVEQ